MGKSLFYNGKREFDHDKVTALCRAIIANKRRMFDALPAWGDDDLLQECLLAAAKAHNEYEPGKGYYSSWLGRFVNFRLLDLGKVKARELKREREVAEGRPEDGSDAISKIVFVIPHGDPVYIRAAANRHRGGRLGWDARVLANVVRAKVRSGMGWRGYWETLRDDSDVRREAGLGARVPSLRTLMGFMPKLARWRERKKG